jgi:hypothetical protein
MISYLPKTNTDDLLRFARTRMKPLLDHPLLEPFEPILKSLLELGFDGGVRSLSAAGYKLGDDLVNDDAREHFRNGLFSSFAQTQSAVGMLFIELEAKRRELSEQAKCLRSNREPAQQAAQEQLQAVESRQAILRRLMDGILWVLLPEVWMARHLAFQRNVGQPDPDELRRILAIAKEQNQTSKREIHLVTDLTTIAQIGDIIRIRWDKDDVYLRLQEIKFGKVNDTLSHIIDSGGDTLSETDLAAVETKLGRHARIQATRMIRQRERIKKFGSIMAREARPNDLPKDDVLEALGKAEPPKMVTYLSELPELAADVKARGWGVHGIDGCLWLVGMSERGLAELGLADLKHLPHFLFHIKHPKLKCQIEERETLKREPPLVNLAAHNMTYVMSRSPLIWYPKDLILDVMMNRIQIYVQFDLDAFFRIAAKAGMQLTLITGKEAEEGKRTKVSSPMLENPKAYGVKVKFANGRVMKLRSSLFRDVYANLIPPSQILRLIATLDKVQQGVGKSSA